MNVEEIKKIRLTKLLETWLKIGRILIFLHFLKTVNLYIYLHILINSNMCGLILKKKNFNEKKKLNIYISS